jgi:hypothetical protein
VKGERGRAHLDAEDMKRSILRSGNKDRSLFAVPFHIGDEDPGASVERKEWCGRHLLSLRLRIENMEDTISVDHQGEDSHP